MSLDIVRQVHAAHPHLLQTNTGSTCHQFTLRVIDALRASGRDAYLMCKSPGEGQYVPPGFQPRTVTGLDGKPYVCSGVSHDAIWSDGLQVDTIASANDGDHPLFDPITPQRQIVGSPVWNAVPAQFWRVNNPPLKGEPVVSPPQKLSAQLEFPPRDYVGRFFGCLNEKYWNGGRKDRTNGGELYVDNEGLFVWLSEYIRHYVQGSGAIQERHDAAMKAVFDEIGDRL